MGQEMHRMRSNLKNSSGYGLNSSDTLNGTLDKNSPEILNIQTSKTKLNQLT